MQPNTSAHIGSRSAAPDQQRLTATTSAAHQRSRTPEPASAIVPLETVLPQQVTPKPHAKMKTINWNKIPPNKVLGKHNIWTMLATSHADQPQQDDLDWGEMEGLFCLNNGGTSGVGSPSSAQRGLPGGPIGGGGCRAGDVMDGGGQMGTLRKENAEITLLDGKRCLNVNIFLKQFRA